MTKLRDPFDVTYEKGGFTYISWSQCADRLDDAAPRWSFEILRLGDDWCHGRLTIDGRIFENIGYAENADQNWKKEPLKDAVSDALKRCAALAGVARYLYDKEAPISPPRPPVKSAPPAGHLGEGSVHAEGHKPLRSNARGLFCPTKMPDGSWCPWRDPNAGRPAEKPKPVDDFDAAWLPMEGVEA